MSLSGDLGAGTPAGGIAFTGCAMMAGAASSPASPPHAHAHGRRREVVVNGKRVKTIDVHAHCAVPAAMALVKHPLEAPGLLMSDTTHAPRRDGRAGHRCRGAQHQSLLVPRRPRRRGGVDQGSRTRRWSNSAPPAPTASSAFATVALQFPDLAAQQLEHAVKKLGFRGVGVAGSVAGEELANPKFHPFWAKCEELGVLVFLHPLGTRELEPSGRLGGSGLLTNTIGNPLETTIALSHLIFEGTLDRFPGLKICAAHGGGFLPSYANRSDAVIRTFPNRVGPLPKKNPTDYLRDGQLYLRHYRVHPRGAAPPDRRDRPGQDHDRHRLSVPMDRDRGRSGAQHAGAERRPADCHPRRDGGAAARHRFLKENLS